MTPKKGKKNVLARKVLAILLFAFLVILIFIHALPKSDKMSNIEIKTIQNSKEDDAAAQNQKEGKSRKNAKKMRYKNVSLPSNYLSDNQELYSEWNYTLRYGLFKLYKFIKSFDKTRIDEFENMSGYYPIAQILAGFMDKNATYKIASNYCIKYHEGGYAVKTECTKDALDIDTLPYANCKYFEEKDSKGVYYEKYDVANLFKYFEEKGIKNIQREIDNETEKTYQTKVLPYEMRDEKIKKLEADEIFVKIAPHIYFDTNSITKLDDGFISGEFKKYYLMKNDVINKKIVAYSIIKTAALCDDDSNDDIKKLKYPIYRYYDADNNFISEKNIHRDWRKIYPSEQISVIDSKDEPDGALYFHTLCSLEN